MIPPFPALVACAAHEQRRKQPLPPLGELLPDEAMAIVRDAEGRRESSEQEPTQ